MGLEKVLHHHATCQADRTRRNCIHVIGVWTWMLELAAAATNPFLHNKADWLETPGKEAHNEIDIWISGA